MTVATHAQLTLSKILFEIVKERHSVMKRLEGRLTRCAGVSKWESYTAVHIGVVRDRMEQTDLFQRVQ